MLSETIMKNKNLRVEKIGGTSMTRFPEIIDNVILRNPDDVYGRIYVVSAYGGVTNELLEHKKTGMPGIYQLFEANKSYPRKMLELADHLFELNNTYVASGLDLEKANSFISDRIDLAINILRSMDNVMASGYVTRSELLLAARELLASLGEMHSAFNSANILQNLGYDATFVDLSGWEDDRQITIDRRIKDSFKKIDPFKTICFATGYTKGTEGIMREFDRGYSEVTFSKGRSAAERFRGDYSQGVSSLFRRTLWWWERKKRILSATPTTMLPISLPTLGWKQSILKPQSRWK